MDPKAILAWLAQQLGLGGADDDGGAGEGGVTPEQGEEGADIRADDAPTDDAENIPDDGTGDGSDDAGSADDAGDDAGDSDGEETMPDSDAELAQLRDSITVIATENERLRTILTDNGIDFEGEPEIEAAIDSVDSEADAEVEYDDEAAQADIDAVKTRNAQWDK